MKILFKYLLKVIFLSSIAMACVQLEGGTRAPRQPAASVSAPKQPAETYYEMFEKNRDRLSTIYLKNGNALTGEIVRYAPAHLTVEWKGALITFSKVEVWKIGIAEALVEGMRFKPAGSASWPHTNNPVIQLASGGVIDGAIVGADSRNLWVRESLGEGRIEYDLLAGSVKAILWRPYNESENVESRQRLARQHPELLNYAHATFDPAESKRRIPPPQKKETAPTGPFRTFQNTAQSYAEFWRFFKTFLA